MDSLVLEVFKPRFLYPSRSDFGQSGSRGSMYKALNTISALRSMFNGFQDLDPVLRKVS